MKLTLVLLLAFVLEAGANKAHSQERINLDLHNSSLETVLKEVCRQSGYQYLLQGQWKKLAKNVDVHVQNATIKEALDICFKEQPLSYEIVKQVIIVQDQKVKHAPVDTSVSIQEIGATGKVLNETGQPLGGASITLLATGRSTISRADGTFEFSNVAPNSLILVSYIGYTPVRTTLKTPGPTLVTLAVAVNELDESVVQAYGSTTRRQNVGNIGKIQGKDIASQPVSDPLMALTGRIPGLLVTQNNGVAGSAINIQIRGQNSLAQGSDPLFVIDGVPYAPNNTLTNQLPSAAGAGVGASNPGGMSPFNSINPADIESIEVLKDADATAIFGSRGANGVIMITTKKGKAGKLNFTGSVYSGVSRVTHFMPMMNSQEYVMMRREAFKNDNISPTARSGPDLLFYDTTRYTDIKKLLIGNSAKVTDAQASLSGGSQNTTFLIGAGYHYQSSVYPGNLSDGRGSVHINFNQLSSDRKFSANLSAIYSSDKNNLISYDLTSYFNTPPIIPPLYDSLGNLNWRQKGSVFGNPLSFSKKPYSVQTDNLLSNLVLSYQVIPGLTVKTNFGYNTYVLNEMSLDPISSLFPNGSQTGSSAFGTNNYKSWLIEPQIEYTIPIGKGRLTALAGGSWQEQTNANTLTSGTGYTSDDLLQSLASAANIYASNSNSQYHYQAVFGRLNFIWNNSYVVNFTGRRDGSSRFGPGKQFGNFGSAGAGWIFSSLNFVRNHLPFLSYGKIRGSYGTTGNDQIGDYEFLDSWTNTQLPYAGTPSLIPTRLFNANYSWEVNKKLEFGTELGFLHDKILLTVAWFRNRSSNQLVNYALPAQTGGNSIIKNFPATVQNSGLELSLVTHNVATKHFTWTTSFNFSMPKNKLVSFPGLETSSYSSKYIVGQSLSVLQRFHSLGVDPATGIFIFETKSGQSSAPEVTDVKVIGNADPKYYGGLQNSLSYKGIQLEFFFEFRQQRGRNFKSIIGQYVPGMKYNQPEAFLRRWQKPGDQTDIQQFTANFSNPAAVAAAGYYGLSDAIYSNTSYVRMKNLSLGYNFPEKILKKARLQNLRVYLLAQNIFTITNYEGNDPETQNFYSLPPLKTITAGIQFTF